MVAQSTDRVKQTENSVRRHFENARYASKQDADCKFSTLIQNHHQMSFCQAYLVFSRRLLAEFAVYFTILNCRLVMDRVKYSL